MTWTLSRLTVRLNSPLRCGDRPLGFIARTLPFVPAHIPLMALAATAVPAFGLDEQRRYFAEFLDFFKKHFRFTPFYVQETGKDGPGKTLFPFKGSEDLRKLQYTYLRSRHGVSLDYTTRTAQDAHLFETETLIPVTKNGARTRLQGYVFLRLGTNGDKNVLPIAMNDKGLVTCNETSLTVSDLVNRSFWGGERSKGFGSVTVEALEQEKANPNLWNGTICDLTQENPIITWPKRDATEAGAPFFLECPQEDGGATEKTGLWHWVSGDLRPVAERNFNHKGPGHDVRKSAIIWDIGWTSEIDLVCSVGTHCLVYLGQDRAGE